MTYTDDAKGLQDDLVLLRRDLHRIPEIGLDLPRTQERVLAALDGLPLEITLGAELNSVTAVLRGTGPAAGGADAARQAVLLRGDMDALPVVEKTGRDFTADGRHMHACGHDLHTAHAGRRGPAAVGQPRPSWPATWCSCSSPARRATTAPAA